MEMEKLTQIRFTPFQNEVPLNSLIIDTLNWIFAFQKDLKIWLTCVTTHSTQTCK
jgi:hypothetical protein